jgi:hypothetical protein
MTSSAAPHHNVSSVAQALKSAMHTSYHRLGSRSIEHLPRPTFSVATRSTNFSDDFPSTMTILGLLGIAAADQPTHGQATT